MSLTVSMAASWDDAYPDPDVLEQVQRAIAPHLPADVRLDWDAVRQIRATQRVSFGVSRDYVGTLEDVLIDLWGRDATSASQFDLVPFPLVVDWVDMGVSTHTWRLYSAVTVLEYWQHVPVAEQRALEQLAQAFVASDTPAHNQYRLAGAYCLTELVRVARACVEQRLPARVYW